MPGLGLAQVQPSRLSDVLDSKAAWRPVCGARMPAAGRRATICRSVPRQIPRPRELPDKSQVCSTGAGISESFLSSLADKPRGAALLVAFPHYNAIPIVRFCLLRPKIRLLRLRSAQVVARKPARSDLRGNAFSLPRAADNEGAGDQVVQGLLAGREELDQKRRSPQQEQRQQLGKISAGNSAEAG
jgi:hypothetical protein